MKKIENKKEVENIRLGTLMKANLPKILVESALSSILFAIEGYALNISIIFLPICMILCIVVKLFDLVIKKK